MGYLDLIGYIAGALVIGSLIPQMIKSWRTKSTKDLSLGRYLIYISGIIMWLVYSFLILNKPMIISNIIALMFASSILFLKLRYG